MKAWGPVFVDHPWSALVVSGLFAALWVWRGRRRKALGVTITAALPALAWFAYAVYEWRMALWSDSVIAPIRVDLLIVIPALLAISLLGVAAMAAGTA